MTVGSRAKRNRREATERRAGTPVGRLRATVRDVDRLIVGQLERPVSEGPRADPATWGGTPKPKKRKRKR
jgi:hypothetical protein